ncbi:MAG TPA: glycosyltransferase, partial [Allocoleopsis sp.]
MSEVGFGITALSLVSWLYLLLSRGQFWQCDQKLESLPQPDISSSALLPYICAIIPARNEADLLPITLRSLLQQDYTGQFSIILVDDHSTDGTAEIAQQTALDLGKSEQLHLHQAAPLPAGWTGKLWAMHQGVQIAES